jgi:hypothetical protein
MHYIVHNYWLTNQFGAFEKGNYCKAIKIQRLQSERLDFVISMIGGFNMIGTVVWHTTCN